MFEIREVTYLAVIVRIAIALLLGGILGLERELKSRAAGLRTYMLVSVGACMIMLANQYVYQVFEVGDPVGMGAQVVSGIGFLGAGTIIVTQKNKITGLTTAAGLWEAAAVGLCVGIGFYEAAAVGTFLAIFILTAIHRLEALVRKHSVSMELYLEVSASISIGKLVNRIRELGVKVDNVQIDKEYSIDNTVRALMLSIHPKKRVNRKLLIEQLKQLDGVIFLEDI